MALVKLKQSCGVLTETLKKFEWKDYRRLTCPAPVSKRKLKKRKKLINEHGNVILCHSGSTRSYLAEQLNVPKEAINLTYIKIPLLKIRLRYIEETLNFLKNRGFENSVIAESAVICFYPIKDIEKGLVRIAENEDKLSKVGLIGGFSTKKKSSFTCGTLLQDKRLQLCLYYIEQPFGFTGHGCLDVE